MNTLCIIPARGGSKGLPRKNIRLLAGKPLITWPIKAALASSLVDEVFVTTDNEEIADAARQGGANVPFLRSSKYAEDLTTTEDTLKHALDSYEEYTGKKYDICVFLTATDIFRRVEWIDDAIKTLLDHKDIESAFSANETTKNYWTKSDNGWDRILPWMREYSSRQIRNKIYREDTGIACASRAELWRQGRRIGDNVHIIPNSFTEVSIDIHTEFDLFMAENAIEYLKINDPDRVSIFME